MRQSRATLNRLFFLEPQLVSNLLQVFTFGRLSEGIGDPVDFYHSVEANAPAKTDGIPAS